MHTKSQSLILALQMACTATLRFTARVVVVIHPGHTAQLAVEEHGLKYVTSVSELATSTERGGGGVNIITLVDIL